VEFCATARPPRRRPRPAMALQLVVDLDPCRVRGD
jgi:hypothetical protein